MIIEVTLDGRGQVRIETEYAGSPKQIKGLVDHAARTITRVEAKPQGYGFGAGGSTHLGHGEGSEADPTEFGWVVR
ncbi:hypothetical protein [Actinophytocola sp. NPDC049390]|uniref:hypothetical protein n=1 Tax=Actinophytocola sp. NPDC049390 TaxID=3363894 RepID=UPI00378E91C1